MSRNDMLFYSFILFVISLVVILALFVAGFIASLVMWVAGWRLLKWVYNYEDSRNARQWIITRYRTYTAPIATYCRSKTYLAPVVDVFAKLTSFLIQLFIKLVMWTDWCVEKIAELLEHLYYSILGKQQPKTEQISLISPTIRTTVDNSTTRYIYLIISKHLPKIYIGATNNPEKRKQQHFSAANNYHSGPLYDALSKISNISHNVGFHVICEVENADHGNIVNYEQSILNYFSPRDTYNTKYESYTEIDVSEEIEIIRSYLEQYGLSDITNRMNKPVLEVSNL